MPRKSPYEIRLTDEEQRTLESVARRYTSPYFNVLRARIVLLAAEGKENKEIADYLHIPFQIVFRWRKRFFYERLPGLDDRPRSGRPAAFSPSGRR